jgi:hypothetical protein
MQFERGKPPENPNAPYRAARVNDERLRSAGPGFEPGRAGPRLSLTPFQDAEAMRPLRVRCLLVLTIMNHLANQRASMQQCGDCVFVAPSFGTI